MIRNILGSVALILLATRVWAATPVPVLVDPLIEPSIKSPLAISGALLDVAEAGDRLVAVGERGHILFSDDRGEHWIQAEVPVSVTLTAVEFSTPLRGWAVGHGMVILSTDDGGATWRKQTDGRALVSLWQSQARAAMAAGESSLAQKYQRYAEEGADKPLLDVAFIDGQKGYASGAYGVLLMTHDGGLSWQSAVDRLDALEDRHIYDIEIKGQDLYLAGEMGLVYYSNDAGEHLSVLDTPVTASLFGIRAVDDGVVLIGLRGTLWTGQPLAGDWKTVPIATEYSLVTAAETASGNELVLGDAGGGLWSLRLGSSPVVSSMNENVGFPLAALQSGQAPATMLAVGAAGARMLNGGDHEQ